MKLIKNKIVDLVDAQQQQVGRVTIERNEDNLIFGTFAPCAAFSAVAELFQDFEKAVNLQALSVVDDLDAKIATLGLHLRFPDGFQIEIHDVQIWSDGGITCRLYNEVPASVDKVSTQLVQAVGTET